MNRQAANRYSVEACRSSRNESSRDAFVSSSSRQQVIHDPSPAVRERQFEKLRKLGATPFSGTLDPAVAESWLESIERVFILIQCTPEENFDYAVFLLQGGAYN